MPEASMAVRAKSPRMPPFDGLLTAGLVSPRVGDSIQHRGGRPVLAVSELLLALGLIGLALAPALPIYLASWLVLGIGMGTGLYDAAFATLGRLYGQRARRTIATLTLFGGFASTVCWPLSAMMVTQFGWRGVCLIYAGIQLAIALPLYLFVLPSKPQQPIAVGRGKEGPPEPPGQRARCPRGHDALHPARRGDHHRLDDLHRDLRPI
jgi:MFS family permease